MTRIILTITAFISLTAIFSSCQKIVGTGPAVSETRTISAFSSVTLAMDATVNITEDSIFKVEVQAQSNVLPEILTYVSGSRLVIQHRNVAFIKASPISINISMPSVQGLNVSGSGAIQVQNQIVANSFDMNVSGSGDISIPVITANSITSTISGSGKVTINSGTTNTLNSKISGSGDMDMQNVPALSVTTSTSGSGTTKVYAKNSLYVKISGSGDVYYKGNPSIDFDISGSGKLIRL